MFSIREIIGNKMKMVIKWEKEEKRCKIKIRWKFIKRNINYKKKFWKYKDKI